jgi:hypothetical protein
MMPFFELFCFVFWKQSLILIMPDSDGYINCMEGSSAKGEYICRHNFYNKWLISCQQKGSYQYRSLRSSESSKAITREPMIYTLSLSACIGTLAVWHICSHYLCPFLIFSQYSEICTYT